VSPGTTRKLPCGYHWKAKAKNASGNSLNSKQSSRVFGRRSQSYRGQRFEGPQSQMPNSVKSKLRNFWKPTKKTLPGIRLTQNSRHGYLAGGPNHIASSDLRDRRVKCPIPSNRSNGIPGSPQENSSGNSLNSKQSSRVFGRWSQSYRVQRFEGPQSQMPNSVKSTCQFQLTLKNNSANSLSFLFF
jgi:hypothetical protein